MSTLVLSDRGRVGPRDLDRQPLAGAESAFVELARALARRGHEVFVRIRGSEVATDELGGGSLDWGPLERPLPSRVDCHVANRDPRLLGYVPQPGRRLLWLHNTARYLLHPRFQVRLLRYWPTLVFSGSYHRSTYPWWLPAGRRVIIPYGIQELFRQAEPATEPPPPRAIFTSNPLRGLDWLLGVWRRSIHPAVPNAELHLFSGPETYGDWGAKVSPRMREVLEQARAAADVGVVVRRPVSKRELVGELRGARVMPYRGDLAETFCLAVAEAQAVGVPSVVQPFGSMAERAQDGETGFVDADDDAFARHTVALLTDDDLWRRMQRACLERRGGWTWDEAAAAFERLVPGR